MIRLGEATLRVAERATLRRLAQEDADRIARLGDTEGQTERAHAFARSLDATVLVEVHEPVVSRPRFWPRG